MADVISGNGRIILDGNGVADDVFYWLTISDEPGNVVAEGSISASEDLLRKVKKAERATLALWAATCPQMSGRPERCALGQGAAGLTFGSLGGGAERQASAPFWSNADDRRLAKTGVALGLQGCRRVSQVGWPSQLSSSSMPRSPVAAC